ncbi:hypothetical protein QN219_01000 [Sinorhizobium sp. 7-81]|uniref:hypothetical protein n=1 Tax=Sinorhizobium sp. 8-89 TaxID=3049089 RepID=UPI0024C25FDE|nr:hypothetical protein [Sinorhizobium sp. 8-89]MDK1488641.1 hypothetical protein [Sinorhizobium sp. 8-89]
MTDFMIPNMNCANFSLPYPEEIVKKTGSTGIVASIRQFYLSAAAEADDKEPQWAAFLREVADYYPDTNGGEIIDRDSRGNIVVEEDDWDDLTDEQKIHRGNVNAAIAVVDRIRYQLENAAYYYDTADDVTRVRRELAAISL